MKVNKEWQDYSCLATGGGEKLERWKDVYLLRPDPQVIWPSRTSLKKYPKLCAHYIRSSSGGGYWENLRPMKDEWVVSWRDLKFKIKPMGFKHTGLFPEQAVNWAKCIDLIKSSKREIKVLNLFAYTGGATVACVSAGAHVTHVDASKAMVERAKENIKLSSLPQDKCRFIVDDCFKFVEREIRRGNKYDAIILDPPSFGRGPNGETWKIENNLYDFLTVCRKVLSEKPLFVLLNSYTTGLQPTVISNLLNLTFGDLGGKSESYEVGLDTEETGVILPCGCSGFIEFN